MYARISATCLALALGCTAAGGPSRESGLVGRGNSSSVREIREPLVPRSSPRAPVDLARISATPKTFVPGETDVVTLRFAAGAETPVRVEIRSEEDVLVRAFELESVGPAGTALRWDGLDLEGRPAPTGIYLYRMYALDDEGRVRGAYGSEGMGGGEEILPQRFTFDPETGLIDFTLLEPGRVRLRMGLKGLPVLRTYYAWEPLEAGRHTIEWDGLDVTGQIRLAEHPRFQVNLEAESLPQNAVYLRRDPVSTRDPCAEVCFRVEVLDPLGRTDDGRAIVGDQATLRIRVDDAQERARLLESRFEIMLFLDTVYLFEEEDGVVPFTYRLDTRGLAPGSHLVTINLLGYDQRLGIQTLELVRAEPGRPANQAQGPTRAKEATP